MDRIQLVDVLRGFALLGILLVNFDFGSSEAVSAVIAFIAEDSFYPIFSLLFGLGFSLQMSRERSPSAMRYIWRSAVLLAIGLLHHIFVWRGEILKIYAVLSVVLLLVRAWPPTALLAAAGAVFAFSLLPPSIVPRPAFGPQNGQEAAAAQGFCQAIPGLSPSYRADVCRSAAGVQRLFLSPPFWYSKADVLAMFLLGAYIGRRRIFARPAEHARLLAVTAAIGLGLGLGTNVIEHLDIDSLPAAAGVWVRLLWIGNYGLALFYLAGLTWLWAGQPQVRGWLAPLADVGRMTLTHYVLQSVVFVLLIPRSLVDGWWNLPALLLFFVLQVVFSRWWLAHFERGPLEWAWRSLTWWRLFPMLVKREVKQ